jgi:hypothetical protein
VIQEHESGFKCYRSPVVTEINRYGLVAGVRGFKCAEIEVEYEARKFVQSGFGVESLLLGLMERAGRVFGPRNSQAPIVAVKIRA